jgi:hypothetical protein
LVSRVTYRCILCSNNCLIIRTRGKYPDSVEHNIFFIILPFFLTMSSLCREYNK